MTRFFLLSLALIGCTSGPQGCEDCSNGGSDNDHPSSCETNCSDDTGDPSVDDGTLAVKYTFEETTLACSVVDANTNDILGDTVTGNQTGITLPPDEYALRFGDPSQTTVDGFPTHLIEEGEYAGYTVTAPGIDAEVDSNAVTTKTVTANAVALEVEWTCWLEAISGYNTYPLIYENGETIHLPGLPGMKMDGLSGEYLEPENDAAWYLDFEAPDYISGTVTTGSVSWDFRCFIGGEEDDPEPELAE